MTSIVQGSDIVTFINVFTVAPMDQQRVVDYLATMAASVMNKQPGFISSNIHKSLDGTRVVNYVQWRSRADFEAAMANPEVQSSMDVIAPLVQAEPHLYEVAFIYEAPKEARTE